MPAATDAMAVDVCRYRCSLMASQPRHEQPLEAMVLAGGCNIDQIIM